MKAVILGASGMLGSMVLAYLARDPSLELTATVRSAEMLKMLESRLSGPTYRMLDAETCSADEIARVIGGAPWVINAIGVIKPFVKDDNPVQVERAVRVNALFPHTLARAAHAQGFRVLQIATDCVYSGLKGNYVETDEHDPTDVYGKTKSLGEAYSPDVFNLRCSIIGPEPKGHVSLLDWFLGQTPNATVTGFLNQSWNGVTTLQFARVCQGIMKKGIALPHVQHVIPAGAMSKADMLECFASAYRRLDITINRGNAARAIDRTLATTNEALNRELWSAAGYTRPPSVPDMVNELARFGGRLAGAAK